LVRAEEDVAGLELDGLVDHVIDGVLRRQAAYVHLQRVGGGGRLAGTHDFSPSSWRRASASSSATPNRRSMRQNCNTCTMRGGMAHRIMRPPCCWKRLWQATSQLRPLLSRKLTFSRLRMTLRVKV